MSFCSSQFLRHDPVDGKIPEWEFAELLVAYAGLNDKKKNRMLKRIKKVSRANLSCILDFCGCRGHFAESMSALILKN